MPEYPTLANFWNLRTSAYFFPGTGELGLQQTENDARACLSPDCLVPEERIVADAFPLLNSVNRNAQIDSLIHENELASRHSFHEAGSVQHFVSHFDVEFVARSPPVRSPPLCSKADFEFEPSSGCSPLII